MKANIYRKDELGKLLDKVRKDDANKIDFRENANKLRINSEGRLYRISNRHKEGLRFSEYAFTQLLNRYKLPVRETKLILMHNPSQVYNMLNTYLSSDGSEVLIRSRLINGEGVIRAILSESYSMLNTVDILENVDNIIKDYGEELRPKIETSYIDDGRSHVRITFDPYTEAFGKDILGTDDLIKSGIDIVNSETGRSSFRIEPLVYRLVCSNGLKAWSGDQDIEKVKQRHIFISNRELNKIVHEGIKGSVSKAMTIATKFEETKRIVVPNPIKVIKAMCEDQKYSQKLTSQVVRSFSEEPVGSRYGVVNAFTRGARGLGNVQRLEVEEFAGRLLTDEKLYEKVA